jgi:hypothetical protein
MREDQCPHNEQNLLYVAITLGNAGKMLNKKHQDYSTDLLSLDILLFSSSYQEDLL